MKMIDWVTARLPCSNSGQICDGQVVKLNAEGSEIEWTLLKQGFL